MEPISKAATKDILKYLYEQGLLSSAYNEETENEIISSVQEIIEKHYSIGDFKNYLCYAHF